MKFVFATIISLFLFNAFALAGDLECYNNTANQNVKKICVLRSGETNISGFLLMNADGTKSYLVVVRSNRKGYGSQEYGRIEWNYTVQRSDSELVSLETQSSKIQIVQSWEYSDGGSTLTGETPGGIRLAAILFSYK